MTFGVFRELESVDLHSVNFLLYFGTNVPDIILSTIRAGLCQVLDILGGTITMLKKSLHFL